MRPLSQTLPILLQEETTKLLAQVSLPATARIFLSSISKFLPQLTENQANEVANAILNFAGRVWQLQQDASAPAPLIVEAKIIEQEEEKIRAFPAASA